MISVDSDDLSGKFQKTQIRELQPGRVDKLRVVSPYLEPLVSFEFSVAYCFNRSKCIRSGWRDHWACLKERDAMMPDLKKIAFGDRFAMKF